MIGATPLSGDSIELIYTVTDTGPGIPSAQKETIFEVFRQGDGSMSRKYGGTGLGLAISKSLAELMGGSLTVESEPGRGSMYFFRVRVRSGRPPAEVLAPVTPEHDGNGFRSLHLLLAEDHPIDRELGGHSPDQAGSRTGLAVNGKEAANCLS